METTRLKQKALISNTKPAVQFLYKIREAAGFKGYLNLLFLLNRSAYHEVVSQKKCVKNQYFNMIPAETELSSPMNDCMLRQPIEKASDTPNGGYSLCETAKLS